MYLYSELTVNVYYANLKAKSGQDGLHNYEEL